MPESLQAGAPYRSAGKATFNFLQMKRLSTIFLTAMLCANFACSSEPTITDAIEAESNAYAPVVDQEPLYMVDDTSFILNDTVLTSSVDTIVYPER